MAALRQLTFTGPSVVVYSNAVSMQQVDLHEACASKRAASRSCFTTSHDCGPNESHPQSYAALLSEGRVYISCADTLPLPSQHSSSHLAKSSWRSLSRATDTCIAETYSNATTSAIWDMRTALSDSKKTRRCGPSCLQLVYNCSTSTSGFKLPCNTRSSSTASCFKSALNELHGVLESTENMRLFCIPFDNLCVAT